MLPANKLPGLVRAVACGAALAVCVGCGDSRGNNGGWVAEGIPLYYTIYDYSNERPTAWVLDGEGNTIPEEERFTVLYDQGTGAPQCLMRTYQVPSGEFYGDGGLHKTKDISALYDLAGNLLYDWDEVYYQGGFGDYLIRQNRSLSFAEGDNEDDPPPNFETALWNYVTNQTLFADVGAVMAMGDEEHMLLADIYSYGLCVVDYACQIQGAYPLTRELGRVSGLWNGYIITTTRSYYTEEEEPPVYALVTQDYEVLVRHEYISGGRGETLLWAYDGWDTPAWSSFLLTTGGEAVYPIQRGGPRYFDDELCVLDLYDENEGDRYDLARIADGAVLAEGYEILTMDYEADGPVQSFVGYLDGVLCVLDRQGEVTARRELPGVRYIELYSDGLIRCSIDMGEDSLYDLILDSDLQDRMGGGEYRNIMQITEWVGDKRVAYPLFTAQRWIGTARLSVLDIYDISGNLVLEDIKLVHAAGPDRLAVRKGFEEGLMDWEGNWIVKRSIFSRLWD